MQPTVASSCRSRRGRTAGFTLIELMIVAVVAAILAAIALPGFLSQIRSARRADAITTLSRIAQAQERYRANNATFGDRFIVSGGALTGSVVGVSTDTGAAATYTTTDGYYQLSLSGVSGTAYTVLATAQNSQANDGVCKYMQVSMSAGNLTYNSGATSGTSNGATSTANKRCWKK